MPTRGCISTDSDAENLLEQCKMSKNLIVLIANWDSKLILFLLNLLRLSNDFVIHVNLSNKHGK